MPTVVRLSKMASRIACSSTAATWMFSLMPWWNSIVNSVSPRSRAMAAVELKAPAARARERHRVERAGAAALGQELAAAVDQERVRSPRLAQEVQENAVDPLRGLFVDGQIVM